MISLDKTNMRDAISYCSNVDLALSETCSGSIIPLLCCQKPTIRYGNKEYLRLAPTLKSNSYAKIIETNMVFQVDNFATLKGTWKGHMDYFIPPEHIYNLAAEVLEELSAAGKLKVKNLKMHRLDVPPVELIAKQYELEQKLNIKFSIENVALFSELEKKIDTLALNNTAIINNANNTTLLIQNKDQYIHNLEQNIQNLNHQILFKTAKARIQNHLSYKLGQALIKADKEWYKAGYVKFYFKDVPRLKRKFGKKGK